MASTSKPKKEKSRITKLIEKSDSEEDGKVHELSYYVNDRVKLMKEVLKIIKPKKVKSMAPDCLKGLDVKEINSLLLEELLGISNKRLKYIFEGKNLNEDTSSSTDPEDEEVEKEKQQQQNDEDIISLSDISDSEFVIDLDSTDNGKTQKKRHRHHSHNKNKDETEPGPSRRKIKKEKSGKSEKSSSTGKSKTAPKTDEQSLMSVLELLELQARARAIRSQLQIEASNKKNPENSAENRNVVEEDNNFDDVIIESPKNEEIVITSSESENEHGTASKSSQKNAAENVNSTTSNIVISEKSSGSNLEETRDNADIITIEDDAGSCTAQQNQISAKTNQTKDKESERDPRDLAQREKENSLHQHSQLQQLKKKIKLIRNRVIEPPAKPSVSENEAQKIAGESIVAEPSTSSSTSEEQRRPWEKEPSSTVTSAVIVTAQPAEIPSTTSVNSSSEETSNNLQQSKVNVAEKSPNIIILENIPLPKEMPPQSVVLENKTDENSSTGEAGCEKTDEGSIAEETNEGEISGKTNEGEISPKTNEGEVTETNTKSDITKQLDHILTESGQSLVNKDSCVNSKVETGLSDSCQKAENGSADKLEEKCQNLDNQQNKEDEKKSEMMVAEKAKIPEKVENFRKDDSLEHNDDIIVINVDEDEMDMN